MMGPAHAAAAAAAVAGQTMTVLGFGSLMSESSVRSTTPSMRNFRYVRILGHRRVFAHTPPIFYENGIAKADTLEVASLSAEPCEGGEFCGVAFEIPADEWPAFVEREDEYILKPSPFVALENPASLCEVDYGTQGGEGWLCTRSSDEALKERGVWPRYLAAIEKLPAGAPRTCWHWAETSGLLPCPAYLRHCLLSSERADVPEAVRTSFLDATFLVDRTTSLRAYLERPGVHEYIRNSHPPPSMATRYGG